MSKGTLEKELQLIRQRLDSIEEVLAEEMTEDDKRALEEALKEHREGKTVPFKKSKASKHWRSFYQVELDEFLTILLQI